MKRKQTTYIRIRTKYYKMTSRNFHLHHTFAFANFGNFINLCNKIFVTNSAKFCSCLGKQSKCNFPTLAALFRMRTAKRRQEEQG